ncbi:MAG TPA: SRPBCC family protein [Nitrospiraceae bacterium]|nr:SRPBCC family protein [Nitrospiraceae bacterium]
MSTIEKSIEINVPVYVAYSQWTRFAEFPRFMEGVKEVKQLDAKRLHWKAEIAGRDTEWDTDITEQTADQRLALTNRDGAIKGMVATFQELSNDRSTVRLQVEYNPQGAVEPVGDALGVVSLRVQGDLERFKGLVEKRWVRPGRETIFDNFPM